MNFLSPATPVLNYGQLVNRASPLNRGLVAWWLALPQGGKGNTFFDICGKNHGTLTNGPTWGGSLGRPGGHGALDFDGSNDYVNLGTGLDQNGELTASAWFNSRVAAGSDQRHIISNSASGGSDNDYIIEFSRTAGKLSCVWGGNLILTATTAVATNEWHHAVLVRSGASSNWTVTIYLDGKSDGSTTSAVNPNGSSAQTAIGAIGAGNARFWNGRLDDVRLWAKALSAADVAALYNDSRYGYPTTLNRIRLPVYGEAGGAAPTTSPFYFRHYIAGRAA